MPTVAPKTANTRHSYRTRNPDLAKQYVTDAFTKHELAIAKCDEIKFRLDAVNSGILTVGRMAYGADASLYGTKVKDSYHVNMLTAGRSEVEQGGYRRRFSAASHQSGTMFGPEPTCYVAWTADATHYHLQVPNTHLERHAAALIGSAAASTIDFDLSFDLHSSGGKSLLSSVAFFYPQLSQSGIPEMPTVLREYESALMTHLLMVVPNSLSDELHDNPAPQSHSQVRDVMRYIEQHAQEDLSLATLARHEGVTLRTLQSSFRREIDMTPSEFIRHTRLERARRDLLTGNGSSVSDIAARWQFFHIGRFAGTYRKRYGESPSVRLRAFNNQVESRRR